MESRRYLHPAKSAPWPHSFEARIPLGGSGSDPVEDNGRYPVTPDPIAIEKSFDGGYSCAKGLSVNR